MDSLEIRNILNSFQQGYIKKNIEAVDDFVESIFVIKSPIYYGTSSKDQSVGLDNVKRLVENDWRYWGDLNLDIENAIINTRDDFAVFITNGTVNWGIHEEAFLNRSLDDIERMMTSDSTSKEKLMAICNNATKILYEAERGNVHILPIRVSGVMIKERGFWKIYQLHISHPTELYPDSRIV